MRANVRFLALVCVAAVTPCVHAELFVDLGLSNSRVEADIATLSGKQEDTSTGVHLGIGVRRTLQGGNDIGARLELDDVDSDMLLTVRALDYRFHVSERFAVSAFLGAARLDLATPAYGYYLGGGVQLKDIFEGWDLGIDVRIGDKIARDNLLPTDPQGGRPDNFYDLRGLSVYLSYKF